MIKASRTRAMSGIYYHLVVIVPILGILTFAYFTDKVSVDWSVFNKALIGTAIFGFISLLHIIVYAKASRDFINNLFSVEIVSVLISFILLIIGAIVYQPLATKLKVSYVYDYEYKEWVAFLVANPLSKAYGKTPTETGEALKTLVEGKDLSRLEESTYPAEPAYTTYLDL